MIAQLARPMALVSKYRRDDEPVLAAMPLKPGANLAMLSRFRDDRWNLHPAIFRENLADCTPRARLHHHGGPFAAADREGVFVGAPQ